MVLGTILKKRQLFICCTDNIKNLRVFIFNKCYTYEIQSIIGQTDKHKVQPVQSSFTCGMWVFASNLEKKFLFKITS